METEVEKDGTVVISSNNFEKVVKKVPEINTIVEKIKERMPEIIPEQMNGVRI